MELTQPAGLTPPLAQVSRRVHRLIGSRDPPGGVYGHTADPAEQRALYLVESLTNDRINEGLDRLRRLPAEERMFGSREVAIIMAAFCHPTPGGGRFSSAAAGAWYAAFDLDTAVAETIHHNSRRLATSAMGFAARIPLREQIAAVDAAFHDLRGWQAAAPALYDPASYAASQPLGDALRRAGSNGILYDSVRRPGGTNIVVFKPPLVLEVTQGRALEYRWTGRPAPEVVEMETGGQADRP